jgi:two-component system cell cycle sensor histidine kinase/response regulator CckA
MPNLDGADGVSQTELTLDPLTRTAVSLAPRGLYLALGALAVTAVGLALPASFTSYLMFAAAGTLAALAGIVHVVALRHARQEGAINEQIANFVAFDASPSFTTDEAGEIGYLNRVAVERFGSRKGQTLTRTLGEIIASPGAVLNRMQTKAAAVGAAREDIVTRRGHVRLAVHRVGVGSYLWRLEDMVERATGGRGADTISLPMLTVSKTGTVLFMNEALRRLVGERVKTLDRLFTDLPLVSGAEHTVSTANGPIRARIAQVDSGGGRMEVYLLPGPVGAAEAPVTTSATAFDTLPIALLRLSATGQIEAVNRTARTLMGDVPLDVPLSSVLEGLGRPVADWIADTLAGRIEGRTEVLMYNRGDAERFLQVTLSRFDDGGCPGLIAVMSDATQFKTLEAQFVQSQKMQAIGQLAGGIAHDFNNLLTAISGYCDLLLLRHDKGDPDYADLTQIVQNANRAAGLVGQLLAFSRKQTMVPKIIDLRETLSDLTHLLNRLVGEKVHLTLSHDPALSPIRADRRQLEQVFMNLVVNARDAMPAGGTIRIETNNVTLSEPLHRDRATVDPGDYAVVRVIDEGTGIAPEKLPKIFEPFFTTKATGEGTGLGLSTAYGIIKQTGGYIFCDSAPGAGTTFTLYFPTHKAEAVAEVAEPAPLPRRVSRTGQGVVLLVEDEAPVRAFASRALRMRGYTVIEAENAEEALKTLSNADLSVDVFVTDVIMPGMDGPSWVREALRDRPNTRVVFVSGYAEESFADGRGTIPNSVFLPKPFSLSELTATVQGQLH